MQRQVATTCNFISTDFSKKLVMEDLIQNAYILFDEYPPPPPPVLSHVAGPTSYLTYGTAGEQAVGSTTRHQLGLVGGTPTSTQSSFPALHSDSPLDGRLTPTLTPLLSPLLGLTSSSATLKERVETTMHEQVIPDPRGTQAVETTPSNSLSELLSVPPTPLADDSEWWLPQSGILQHPESPTIPHSPSESVVSSTTDLSLSSASLVSSPTDPSSPATSSHSLSD